MKFGYGRKTKTGTSPRIDGEPLIFSKMVIQKGDDAPWPFSFSSEEAPEIKQRAGLQKPAWKPTISFVINLNRSPLLYRKIKSLGPRYCPSIEDKVVRFGDRGGHTYFLEPEGL